MADGYGDCCPEIMWPELHGCVAALELISHGRVRVEEMITHRFGLADTVEGSKLVAAGGDSLKVIIHPQK